MKLIKATQAVDHLQVTSALERIKYDNKMMLENMYGGYAPTGNRRKVLILPAAQIKKDDHLAIDHDLFMMSHVLDQVLRKPHMIGGVFRVIDDFFGPDSHVIVVIYLDGYGGSERHPKGW